MKNYELLNDGIFVESDKGWFIGRENNILFNVDLINKECIPVTIIKKEYLFNYRKHPNCIKYKNIIIALPDIGSDIYFYNILNNEVKWLNVKNNVRLSMITYKEVNGKLFVIAHGLNELIVIDIIKCEINCSIKLYNNGEIPALEMDLINDKLIIPSINSSKYILVDINSLRKEEKCWKFNTNGISNIKFVKSKFVLADTIGDILIYDQENETVDYMFIIDRRYRSTYLKDTNIPLFLCSFQYRNNIAFLPYNLGSRLCNELYILNIENPELNSFPITDLKESKDRIFSVEYVTDENIVIQVSDTAELVEVNSKGIIKKDSLKFSKDGLEKMKKIIVNDMGKTTPEVSYRETDLFNLEFYINEIIMQGR